MHKRKKAKILLFSAGVLLFGHALSWSAEEPKAQVQTDLKAENFRLQGKNLAFQSHIHDLLLEKTKLEARMFELTGQLQNQVELNKALGQKAESLQEFETLKQGLDKKIAELETAIQAKDTEIQELKNSKIAFDENFSSLQDGLEAYKHELGEANRKIKMHESREKKQADVEKTYQVREKEWQERKQKSDLTMIEQQRQISQLKYSLSGLDKRNAPMQKKIQMLVRETDRLNQKIADTQKSMQSVIDQEVSKSQGQYQLAVKDMEELKRENAIVHYNLGTVYLKQGLFEEAANEFKYVLKNAPNHAFAHYNLGLLYDTYLHRGQEAITHYAAYIRLMPNAKDYKDVKYRLFQLRLTAEKGISRDLAAKQIK